VRTPSLPRPHLVRVMVAPAWVSSDAVLASQDPCALHALPSEVLCALPALPSEGILLFLRCLPSQLLALSASLSAGHCVAVNVVDVLVFLLI